MTITHTDQRKQHEWTWQWERLYDNNVRLFQDWIWPNTLEDFRGKDVLDCGCGGGQHLSFVAPYVHRVVGVDLNSTESAKHNTARFPSVEVREGDLATMDLGEQFDIVYCIGVLHHTDSPAKTFQNIARHCKPGGRLILWVYSYEGNFWNRTLLETLKTWIIGKLPRSVVMGIAHALTALLYIPIYSIYLLPLTFLPFYAYFQNWRGLSYGRNLLNVFDKLNAPQTWFLKRSDVELMFSTEQFTDVHISPYVGVSWRASGTKKG